MLVGYLVPRFQQSLDWSFLLGCSQQMTLLPVSWVNRSHQQRPSIVGLHLLYPLSVTSVPSHWCLYTNWLCWRQSLFRVHCLKTLFLQVSLISCIIRFSIYTELSPLMCKHTLKKENPLAPVSVSALLQNFSKVVSFCCLHFPSILSFAQPFSCVCLCEHMDCCPPISSVHGISQAGILEWVVISSSRGSSRRRDWTDVSCVSCIGRQILYRWGTGEAILSWTHSKTYLAATCPPHCWIQGSALFSSLTLAAASQVLRWWSSPPWSTLTWLWGLTLPLWPALQVPFAVSSPLPVCSHYLGLTQSWGSMNTTGMLPNLPLRLQFGEFWKKCPYPCNHHYSKTREFFPFSRKFPMSLHS